MATKRKLKFAFIDYKGRLMYTDGSVDCIVIGCGDDGWSLRFKK